MLKPTEEQGKYLVQAVFERHPMRYALRKIMFSLYMDIVNSCPDGEAVASDIMANHERQG